MTDSSTSGSKRRRPEEVFDKEKAKPVLLIDSAPAQVAEEGLVVLQFWDRRFCVPKDVLEESPYFRRLIGLAGGGFSGKPLSDGSYFINESGENFGEIFERLRGDVRDDSQRFSDKLVTYLPPDMFEIEVEHETHERYKQEFIEYMQSWLLERGIDQKLLASRTERGADGKSWRLRYMYFFEVITLARSSEPYKIIVDSDGRGTVVSVLLMTTEERRNALIESSPIEFLVDLRSKQKSFEIGDITFFFGNDKAMMSMKEISFDQLDAEGTDQVKKKPMFQTPGSPDDSSGYSPPPPNYGHERGVARAM